MFSTYRPALRLAHGTDGRSVRATHLRAAPSAVRRGATAPTRGGAWDTYGGPATAGSGGSAGPVPGELKGRIVLAGGEAAQGLMIRRTLEGDGYEVDAHPTGRAAVLALIAEPADVLLVNAPLGDGSAAALVRWVRARPASALMTCMVLCPSHDSTTVAALYDAGADFVITRRTELDLLPRKVAAALARRPLAIAS
jgi:CheY-like chemotaxis protein